MKTCKACNAPKHLADFYKTQNTRDGHMSKCKICYLRERSAYSKTDRSKEVRKKQRSTPASRSWRKQWRAGPVGRSIQARERTTAAFKERMRRYYLKNAGSDKLKARSAVGMAVQHGKIPPAKHFTCRCGKPAKHYHHHLGYAKERRLHVIPLCPVCHKAAEQESLERHVVVK